MQSSYLRLGLVALTLSLTGIAHHAIAAPAPTAVSAPAGNYQLDRNHSSVSFSVNHLGLSSYIARFTDYDVTLKLDPANFAKSSVTANITPSSIRTDYAGDYKATHKKSAYKSWDEDLALSPKFLNAGQFPEIKFVSTKVSPLSSGKFTVTGNLTFLGKTRPVTLDAQLVGAVAQHPFTNAGALGFSASGTFKRSDFGMTHLLKPALVGDDVTIRFEGEFNQVVPPAK